MFDLRLIWYTVGAVSLPTDPPLCWDSLSARCSPCHANPMSVTMLSHQVPPPVPPCGTREQDGLMAHHFYYSYLLWPCCVGKTDAKQRDLEYKHQLSHAKLLVDP